jgi:outer membrane protein assembly factor BamB
LVILVVAAIALGVFRLTTSQSPTRGSASRHSSNTLPRRRPATHLEATPAVWQLAAPVSRAVALSDGRNMIVLGGLDASQTSASGVYRIDPTTGVSAAMGSLAFATHDAAGAVVGQRYFVFGGGEQVSVDTVQSVGSDGRAAIVAHLPQPRSDLAAARIGGTVYLVGGYDGTTATRDVLATSDGTTFRVVAQLPIGVRYPAVSAIGRRLYVFGGEWAGTESNAVQVVDSQTGRSSVAGHLPAPLTEASAVSLGGSVYVVGGRSRGAATAGILRFDPAKVRFSAAGSLPSPVANAAIVVIGQSAYLVGGEATAPVSGVVVLTRTAATSGVAATEQRPFSGHLLIADRGDNRLILVDASKHVSWVYPSASRPGPPGGFYYPDDGFFADHGHSIISNEEENHTIVRIGFPSGALLWSYGHPRTTGSRPGFLNQPDDAFLLRDGRVMVADAKNCRVLFISAKAQPLSQIGTTGTCVHDPPRALGYPNGDTPLANGNVLVSEIDGSWISEYTKAGSLVWTVHLPIAYPSDPQQLGPDLYLVADYTKPGGILEFNREGQIFWTYRPTSGEGMLDHPSLAERLPNGLIGVNDDYRDRVALIDPSTDAIVWQYGQTDHPGTGVDQVNTPDGFDLLLPDGTTPTHPTTG